MAVDISREDEERIELEALETGAYITGAVNDKMKAALERINGDDKDDKKKDSKPKKEDRTR